MNTLVLCIHGKPLTGLRGDWLYCWRCDIRARWALFKKIFTV